MDYENAKDKANFKNFDNEASKKTTTFVPNKIIIVLMSYNDTVDQAEQHCERL